MLRLIHASELQDKTVTLQQLWKSPSRQECLCGCRFIMEHCNEEMLLFSSHCSRKLCWCLLTVTLTNTTALTAEHLNDLRMFLMIICCKVNRLWKRAFCTQCVEVLFGSAATFMWLTEDSQSPENSSPLQYPAQWVWPLTSTLSNSNTNQSAAWTLHEVA